MSRMQGVCFCLAFVVSGCLSPGVYSGAVTQGTNVSESSNEIPVTNMAPTIVSTDTWQFNSSDEANSQSPTAVFTDTWNMSTPTDEASSQSPTAVFTDTWNMSTPTAARTHDIPRTRRPIRASTKTKKRTTAKRGAQYTSSDNPERFECDYKSLRKWGLVIAFILFTVGILVLFLDRVRMPRCFGCKTGRKHGKYSISTEA